VSATALPPDEIVARLSALPLFESVPRQELEWLAARGEIRAYATDALLHTSGSAIDEMYVLLAGRVVLSVPKGGAWRRIFRAGPGYLLGVVPYSRYQKAPGNVIVEEDLTALLLHRRHFPDLVRECPELTAALVHQMLDRARDYRTVQLQDERMQSLGRLASGLAHELNNPASAAARNAESLGGLLDEAEHAARALAAARLTDAQLAAVDAVCAACSGPTPERSALEAADREDDIAEWLTRHGVSADMAAPLAASEVSLDALDRLANAVPPETLHTAIRWVASGSAARDVARQIASAARRMHDLVRAVKGFTFMDREGVPEEVDVARGLADTIAMLESKSRAKSVAVRLETAEDLPRVYGFGSEINQVWEKLIDNAIDAVGNAGTVTVTATSRGEAVVVKVVDNGRGVLEEHRARIFDPFFTTKAVGQGTGLGLDLARRLVHLHHGDIDFTCQPGRTVFRVRLPVAGAKGGA
jgi:signal transduction histidine kinase